MRPWNVHPAHKNQHHHATKPHKQKQKDKSERSNATDQGDHSCTSAQHLKQQSPLFVSAQNTKPTARQPQTTQQQNPRSQKISDSQVSRNTGKHFSHTLRTDQPHHPFRQSLTDIRCAPAQVRRTKHKTVAPPRRHNPTRKNTPPRAPKDSPITKNKAGPLLA